ncbi:unnamed protein product [Cuscuta campestris]|uniref:Uncharacterized protein n=1 Tax=Cuscuta campestris TaxID=132261 RepID=A0A484MJF9_9ASTE|nr:unnamed protein product [Cuscuta campestris]
MVTAICTGRRYRSSAETGLMAAPFDLDGNGSTRRRQITSTRQLAAAAGRTRASPLHAASGGSGESPVTHSLLRLSRYKRSSSPWIDGDGGAPVEAAQTQAPATAQGSLVDTPLISFC